MIHSHCHWLRTRSGGKRNCIKLTDRCKFFEPLAVIRQYLPMPTCSGSYRSFSFLCLETFGLRGNPGPFISDSFVAEAFQWSNYECINQPSMNWWLQQTMYLKSSIGSVFLAPISFVMKESRVTSLIWHCSICRSLQPSPIYQETYRRSVERKLARWALNFTK